MKLFLTIICLIVLFGICYFIHYISLYIKFKHIKVGDAVWIEMYNDGIIKPVLINKIDINESGKTILIYIENKPYTFKELRKSKYNL